MQQRIVPQKLYDLDQNFGQDISLNSSGDVATVTDSARGQQRVLRRLLTNPGGYIWYPTYGAGLPTYIGQALTDSLYAQITSTITSQMFLEPAVQQIPQPQIFMQTIQGGLFAQIQYTDNATQNPIVINFNSQGLTT